MNQLEKWFDGEARRIKTITSYYAILGHTFCFQMKKAAVSDNAPLELCRFLRGNGTKQTVHAGICRHDLCLGHVRAERLLILTMPRGDLLNIEALFRFPLVKHSQICPGANDHFDV